MELIASCNGQEGFHTSSCSGVCFQHKRRNTFSKTLISMVMHVYPLRTIFNHIFVLVTIHRLCCFSSTARICVGKPGSSYHLRARLDWRFSAVFRRKNIRTSGGPFSLHVEISTAGNFRFPSGAYRSRF